MGPGKRATRPCPEHRLPPYARTELQIEDASLHRNLDLLAQLHIHAIPPLHRLH